MRQIKFRAWQEAHKKMLTYDQLKMTTLWDVFENPQFIVMQGTGFNDDNGREIFTGDIVEIEGQKATVCSDEDLPGFSLIPESTDVLSDDVFAQPWCNIYPHSIIVVGNIYENPNLLEYS